VPAQWLADKTRGTASSSPCAAVLAPPVTVQARRTSEELTRGRGRWDEAKPGGPPPPGERETWRRGDMPAGTSPGADERGGGWRGGGPPGPGAPVGPPARGPPPPGRWGGEDDRGPPRGGGGWGGPTRSSLEELPRRPPPGMGHEDKWGGGGGGGRAPWENDRDHRGGGDREWGGRRDYGAGGGGGGGHPHWEHDPAWMHDGQEGGAGATNAGGVPRPAPPPTARQAMTAKDIERERQEMQAQWRAQQASKVGGAGSVVRGYGWWVCGAVGAYTRPIVYIGCC
jgi:hypothetical protein